MTNKEGCFLTPKVQNYKKIWFFTDLFVTLSPSYKPNYKKMRQGLLILAIGCTMAVQAQKAPVYETSAKDEIAANRFLAGSNYVDYDRQLPTKALTPSPKNYEPYYMSHYGRHGSRWLIGDLGDLTTVGERQHHGIGKRMTQNFPEIFKAKDVKIDARSTTVFRCILSMIAECEELTAANPTARIHNDVSQSLQYYLNQPWDGIVKELGRGTGDKEYEAAQLKYTHPARLMGLLFNDQDYVYNNVKAGDLMRQLFHVACNMQSHDTDIEFFSLFTDEEVYDLWRIQNIGWYLDYGPSPVSGEPAEPAEEHHRYG